jgi:hypothetical protein
MCAPFEDVLDLHPWPHRHIAEPVHADPRTRLVDGNLFRLMRLWWSSDSSPGRPSGALTQPILLETSPHRRATARQRATAIGSDCQKRLLDVDQSAP